MHHLLHKILNLKFSMFQESTNTKHFNESLINQGTEETCTCMPHILVKYWLQ